MISNNQSGSNDRFKQYYNDVEKYLDQQNLYEKTTQTD